MVGKPPRVEVDGGTDVENVGVLALHQVRNTQLGPDDNKFKYHHIRRTYIHISNVFEHLCVRKGTLVCKH